MIEISFPAAELTLAAVWLAFRIAVWIRNRQIRWKREAVLLLMYINLAVLLRITFFPMARVNGHVQPLVFDASAVFPFWINWVPFVHLFDFASKRDLLVNVIGNAAMFVPTGILLPVVFRRLDRFPKVLLAGAGLSLCIELLQLPFSVRASDVDDLILNTLGVIVGYGICSLFRQRKRR